MKRSFVLVFVAMMLFCVIASGGCGGSSSGSGSPSNQTEGDFNSLAGGNTVSNGSGTATGPDGSFELRLNAERTASEGGVSFSNIQNAEVVQVTEDTVNVTMDYKVYWDMYQNGSYVRTEQMSGPLADRGTYSFRRTNNRSWQLVSDRSTRSMTMDFTSNSSARVTETRDDWQVGSNNYQCQVSYTLANQNTTPDNPSTPINFTVLTGTWKASNGSGTLTSSDGTTAPLSLSSSSNNTITFSNVNVNGTSASLEAVLDIYMNIEGYSEEWEDDFGGSKPNDTGVLEFQNTGGNTWRMERTRHNDKPTRTTITFTSSTTANVERYDEYEGQANYSYTLTKQNTPTQETPTTTYSLSVLDGQWTPSNGTATLTFDSGESYTETMNRGGGLYRFSNIQVNGNTATVEIDGSSWTFWDSNGNSRLVGNMDYGEHPAQFQHVSGNVWTWTYTHYGDSGTIKLTIVSPTTLEVEDDINSSNEAGEKFHWTAHYTLTKQDS